MAKKIFYADQARDKVLSGAKQLYDAVKVTFGPKGQNVVIEKSYGNPTITHDGVTVAEAVDLGSSEENLGEQIGAKLIKSAAQKLNKVAGDGTTTVTVLTYNILSEANKLIAAGVNPMEGGEVLTSVTHGALLALERHDAACFADSARQRHREKTSSRVQLHDSATDPGLVRAERASKDQARVAADKADEQD